MKSFLPIGGFHKQSLIDYPGNISAVVFTRGCNFACNYCHNYQLIDCADTTTTIDESAVFDWLEKRKQMLDAVVITGGEPTLHEYLPQFIEKIKKLALKVKLDTNGTEPSLLVKLIREKLVDYVAMDIKAPLVLEKYQAVVGEKFTASLLEKVVQSVNLLHELPIDCEFRTTLDESLSAEDIITISKQLSKPYYIQNKVDSEGTFLTKLSEDEIAFIKANITHPENVGFRNF